jgi:hypothetical protein
VGLGVGAGAGAGAGAGGGGVKSESPSVNLHVRAVASRPWENSATDTTATKDLPLFGRSILIAGERLALGRMAFGDAFYLSGRLKRGRRTWPRRRNADT